MLSSNSPRSAQDFSQNLRLLCGYYKSVAMVCRSLDINRQQFNKYLGAQATPSLFTLRKICAFFGVDEDEIFSEHESFRALLNRQRTVREPDSAVPADFFSQARAGAVEVPGLLLCLFDVAFRIREVIKSITRLTRSGNKILSKTYERVRLGDDQLKSFGINKYRGFCFASSDLIYIVEHEYLSSRGYIWSALYPPIAVASAFSTAWCSACRATIFDVLLVRRLCLSTSVNRSICVTRSPVAAASRLMPLRYPAR